MPNGKYLPTFFLDYLKALRSFETSVSV